MKQKVKEMVCERCGSEVITVNQTTAGNREVVINQEKTAMNAVDPEKSTYSVTCPQCGYEMPAVEMDSWVAS